MKYELETIPIWDAYDSDHECPLCLLQKRAEESYIDFYLGSSVMNPETRVRVNKQGFCAPHFTRLFNARQNRHGLGLVTHTHFKERIAASASIQKRVINKGKGRSEDSAKKLAASWREQLIKQNSSCIICDRIDYTLKRYAFTIIYLWKKDDQDFRRRYSESRGFCSHHLLTMLEMGPELLSGSLYADWLRRTAETQEKAMQRLEGEIFWYTQKFDFQNNDKPWGTSKDAINRVIQKLTGIIQTDD